ncbi:MAG: helix-turn-helix domain-containing protein [Bacteroidetes bacterium]|nr:helix-turn-helix domain-containing protein [Bacteroidota bacterium]
MLLYLTILGFLVTFLILINLRTSNRSNLYLFFFLLINNIYSLSHYAAINSGNKYFIAIMLVHFTPLYLLLGPLFYFYVRGVLNDDHKLSKKDLVHFIPAVIILINISPYLFYSFDQKLLFASEVIANPLNIFSNKFLLFSPTTSFISRPIIIISYIFPSAVLLYNYKLNENYKDMQSKLIFRWLFSLISITLLLYFAFLFFSIIGYETQSIYEVKTRTIYILDATAVGLILLNSSLFFFPNILYGLPQLDYSIVKQKQLPVEIIDALKKEPKIFEISDDKLNLLKSKIDAYLLSLPYLNNNFTLSVMSAETNIPAHHLSYYLNEHLQINFNTWKNDLRINHVIDLIKKGSYESLTLDALSKQSGFGSRSSFINSFKLKTGLTPSEYIQNL